jgi:hypothetical protein
MFSKIAPPWRKSMADEKEKTPEPEISKEQMKFLIKTLWKCLEAPAWTKDSLITLGKVIFAKKTLKDLDDKAFGEIWPHLKVMAETLDLTLSEEAARMTTEAIERAEKPQPEEKKDEKDEKKTEAEADAT